MESMFILVPISIIWPLSSAGFSGGRVKTDSLTTLKDLRTAF